MSVSISGGAITAGVVGSALIALPNSGAIAFVRINADGTVSQLSDVDFRIALDLYAKAAFSAAPTVAEPIKADGFGGVNLVALGIGTAAVTTAGIALTKTFTGTDTNYGIQVQPTQSVAATGFVGIYANVIHSATGTTTSVNGQAGNVNNTSTGTITNAAGISAGILNFTTGVITTGVGVRVTSAANYGAGSITANYGILVDAQTAGVTNYAISTAAGLVQFGDDLILNGQLRTSKAELGAAFPAAYTFKFPIYNAAGQILGYIPII